MPLNAIKRAYRKRIVGNPWLYHTKWWAKDVAESGMVRAKIEAGGLRDVAAAQARSIPFALRIVRDVISNKIHDIRRDRRQRAPRP